MSAAAPKQPNGSWEFVFSYSRWVVEELKTRIPAYAREYNPDWHAWTIDPQWAGVAFGILDKAFGDVTVAEPTPPSQSSGVTADSDYAALHLRESASPELIATAYKLLAKLNHPDRGGDNRAMARINEAFTNLRSRGAA